jgi:hypothetical protein
MSKTVLRPEEQIFRKIYVIRDQKILLDADLQNCTEFLQKL